MKNILWMMLILALAGCSTTNSGFRKPDLTQISIGMSKEQVVSTLGKPDSVSIKEGVEFLDYGWDKAGDGIVGVAEWFFVQIVDGKVKSFGRKGDFGLTANPTVDMNINQKIQSSNQSQLADQRFDLFTELKKLQTLRDDVAITADEYEKLRKAAVEKAK